MNAFAADAAIFATPLKKRGFRGWYDFNRQAEVKGRVVQVAYSSDCFFTFDLIISDLFVDQHPLWQASSGTRYIRVEYETPMAIRQPPDHFERLKAILLGAT